MNNLDGKVALVTGSGRGIGRALVLKLASHGARVVVNDLDQSTTDETVADIRAAGGTAVGCAGNVTDPAFAARFIGTALTTWGGLDIIVNNAGYTWDNVIQKMTDEQFEAMHDVHVKAPFRILREAAEPIRKLAKSGGGRRTRGLPEEWSTSRRSPESTATPARPTTPRPRPPWSG